MAAMAAMASLPVAATLATLATVRRMTSRRCRWRSEGLASVGSSSATAQLMMFLSGVRQSLTSRRFLFSTQKEGCLLLSYRVEINAEGE
jgi:hypothetical protein